MSVKDSLAVEEIHSEAEEGASEVFTPVCTRSSSLLLVVSLMTIFGATAPTGQSEYYVRSRLFTRDFLL